MKNRYLCLIGIIVTTIIFTIIGNFVDHTMFVIGCGGTICELLGIVGVIGFDIFGIRKEQTISNIEKTKMELEFEKMEVMIRKSKEVDGVKND